MDARMVRMIKKAGRIPTEEELKIIGNYKPKNDSDRFLSFLLL